MNPISAYIDALSKYFDYRGTVSRREYWMFMIAAYAIQIIVGVMLLLLFIRLLHSWFYTADREEIDILQLFLLYVYSIAIFFAVTLPSLSLVVRRLNDMGWSRWWLVLVIVFMTPFPRLMSLIPGMSFIISWVWYIPIILFGCIPSRND